MIDECIKQIEKNKLLKKKEAVILAVSGGPDSVFLLELFSILTEIYKNRVIVATFDHMLRKESSDEVKFVERLAHKYGFEFVTEAKDVKAFYDGDSVEQTARRLRYDFFIKLSREFKVKKIVLGHHKDDLMETVLLRLIRGSGLMGLRAMQPLSKFKRIYLVRPLLFFEKQQIVDYLCRSNIPYVTDESNFEDIYLRNRVRDKFLPLFIQANPNIKNAFLNLTLTLAQDYDYINQQTLEAYRNILISHKAMSLRIDLVKLNSYHQALIFHLIRHCISQTKGDLRKIELRHVQEVMDLIVTRPCRSVVDLPNCSVTKHQNELVFVRT